MMLIGDCRQENVIEDIFGSVTDFAREVEENGNWFEYNNVSVTYDEETDIHYFYSIKQF